MGTTVREREGNTRRGWELQCEREREIRGGTGIHSAASMIKSRGVGVVGAVGLVSALSQLSSSSAPPQTGHRLVFL